MTRARDLANIADGTFTATDLDLSGTLSVSGDATFDTNTLFVDVSTDRVGIGTTSPATALDVTGTVTADGADLDGAVVINESGADVDFRVESDTVTHALFVEGGLGFVGIGEGSPLRPLHVNAGTTDGVALFESGDAVATIWVADSNSTNTSQVGLSAVTNDLLLYSGGSERLRIDSSGNVGIGTTNPSRKFNVAASGADCAIRLDNTASGRPFLIEYDDSQNLKITNSSTSGYIAFLNQTGPGTERMRIDSSGNVGIGTTSPAANLDVATSSMLRGDAAAGAVVHTTTFRNTRSGTWNIARIEAEAGGQVWAGDLVFKTAASSFANTLVEHMRLDENGRVGIGTSSPSTPLHVKSSTITKVIAQSERTGSTENIGAFRFMDSTGQEKGGIKGTVGGELIFDVDNISEAMRITDAGDVGIGTSSPDTKLEVLGSAPILTVRDTTTSMSSAVSTLRLAESSGSNLGSYWDIAAKSDGWDLAFTHYSSGESMRIDQSGRLLLGQTSNIATGGKLCIEGSAGADGAIVQINYKGNSGSGRDQIRFYDDGVETGSIEQTTGSSVSYLTSSDYRLKKDETLIVGALNRVLSMRPYKFTWKADGKVDEGFFAHELQEAAPNAVSGEKDAERMQSVDYSKVVPVLTKAIQEQQEIINELRARVAQLEGA